MRMKSIMLVLAGALCLALGWGLLRPEPRIQDRSQSHVDALQDQTPVAVPIELTREVDTPPLLSARTYVVVVDPEGDPVPGASVTSSATAAELMQDSPVAITGADGVLELGVAGPLLARCASGRPRRGHDQPAGQRMAHGRTDLDRGSHFAPGIEPGGGGH